MILLHSQKEGAYFFIYYVIDYKGETVKIEAFEILELIVTLIPVITLAAKGSSMITRLEEMVNNLNKCIQDLREDRERDKQEIKEIQKDHEKRISDLEKDIIYVKESVNHEH